MNASLEELQPQVATVSAFERPTAENAFAAPAVIRSRPQTLLAVPVGACIALAIHFLAPKREPVAATHYYPLLLFVMLALGLLSSALYLFLPGARPFMRKKAPILGVTIVTAGVWELVTSCLG